MEVSGQLHAPAALPQGKSPWYSLDRRLGGPQNRSGRDGEERNSQTPPGIEPENPDRLYEIMSNDFNNKVDKMTMLDQI
jgi:hypothetical protein